MHLLFIEDDPRDIELARIALAKSDLQVGFVPLSDEIQAMDYLFRRGAYAGRSVEEPSVIFLDLKLDDARGSEMIAKIRRVPGLWHIPIVMLTMSHDPADIAECYRRGANAYMVKPIAFADYARMFLKAVEFWTTINLTP